MSQNTEQNAFRSRDAQEDALTYHLGGLQAANNFRLLARAMIQEAEDRGAAEARQKDAATVEIVRQQFRRDGSWLDFTSDDVWIREERMGSTTQRLLYTCPVEIGAMTLERDRLRKHFDEVEKLLFETRKIHSRFMRIRSSLTCPGDKRCA